MIENFMNEPVETIDEKVKPVSKKIKKKDNENVKTVYCGPTIRNVAKQYAVFINGVPEELKNVMDKYPYLKNLMVSIDDFPVTRAAVETKGTPENIIFNKFLKEGYYGI
ncbi:MAG: hypothetical protein Q4B86_07165 [Eubacteriales bacterium]|nr:hypothetical protein [Eubacteriales bacterium]